MIKLLILVLFVTTNLVNSQEKLNYLKCNTSTQCLCMEHGELEIQCPQFDPQVYVRITQNNQVHFECENITNREYDLIPIYNLDVASYLTVTKCPLMPGVPILNSYLKNIRMNRIRTIQYVGGGVNRGTTIESKHFEGFENVTRFDLRGNEEEFDSLPSDLFQNLTYISWLRVRVQKIHLPADLLLPLTNLEFLELGHNKIEKIPPGFFKNQQKLKHLIFWGNNLKNLDKDTFVGLQSVEDLDLSANGLQTLDEDLLKPLINLTEINLSSNNLAFLPKGLLTNNTRLKTFKLLENRIIMLTLPEGLFSNLENLHEVFIKCGLQSLPEDLFQGAKKINEIILESNAIFSLPEKIFFGLSNLEKLDLSKNLISQISEETFKEVTSLKELNLEDNRLKIIPSNAFRSLGSLKILQLSNNKIEDIKYLGLQGLNDVESIELRNNSLDFLNKEDNSIKSSPFQRLKNLATLDLSYNKFQTILEDFTLENLKLLRLEYNNIYNFDINDLQSYFLWDDLTIDLSHNKIKTIDFNGPYSDSEVKISVDLNFNPIECDCKVWEFARYLKNGTNKIKIFHDKLQCSGPGELTNRTINNVDLYELVCPLDNEFTEKKHCPDECKCLARPEDKTLIMNCTEEFNFTLFPSYEDMKLAKTELFIEKSSLIQLPSIERSLGYRNVSKLHLKDNNITEIRFENLPTKLEYIDLSGNKIESMEKNVTSLIEMLPLKEYGLNLTGNPIRCDCRNRDFLNFIKLMNDNKKIANYHQLKCKDDITYFNTVDPSSLCTESKLAVMILCIIVAVLGLVIGLLAALYYKYQKQMKMWLYVNNLCLWFVTEEEFDKVNVHICCINKKNYSEKSFLINLMLL